MTSIARKIAVGSAFALFASTAVTGFASAAPGSLDSGSLGSLAPGFTNPNTLHPHTDVKAENKCGAGVNYFVNDQMWEINWGWQYTDQRFVAAEHWDSKDFGGLTYIDSQYSDKTPAEELKDIREYEAADPAPKQEYHWWYPSREMISKGAELTLGFEDGTVILGEAQVGTDKCPSVRWTEFPKDGEADTTTPESFPKDAPAPTKPVLPAESPVGSLGSLFGS